MKCDLCDKKASIHLTAISNGKKTERHLCKDCAISAEGPPDGKHRVEELLGRFVETHQPSPPEEPPKSGMDQDDQLHYGMSNVPKLWSRRRIVLAAIAAAVGMAVNLLSYVPGQMFGRMLYPWPLLSLRVTRDVLPSLVLLLSQFPLYGALIGFLWPSGLRSRVVVIVVLAVLHLTGIVVWLALPR